MKTITPAELKKKLEQGKVCFIDVREPGEHCSECIEGACLIPLGELSVDKLPTKSLPIVIHCHSGRRSEEACKKLLAQDPNLDVCSLEGGISAWERAGFKIKCMGRKVLSIDRQVQIGVGTLILLSVTLGFFIHPAFFALSAFLGLGLIFAGVTGYCGLAMLLTKMPWNT